MPRIRRPKAAQTATCPGCGSDKARVIQRLRQLNEPDVTGTFKDEIIECPECTEQIFTFDQAEASAKSYAAAVARERNTFTPERLYDLRMSLGWSQEKMEHAFGVGPTTWGRWERGTVPLSGPAARLLWFAENNRVEFHRMVDAHTRDVRKHVKVAGSIMPQGPGESAVGFRSTKRLSSHPGSTSNGGSVGGDGGAV